MVNVIEDKREWNVQAILLNTKCPERYFPANIVGCRVPGVEECNMDKCPFRYRAEVR